jgi:hypothetical protein
MKFRRLQGGGIARLDALEHLERTGIVKKRGYFVVHRDDLRPIQMHCMKGSPESVIASMSTPVYSFPKWSQEEATLVQNVTELENCFGDVVQRQIVFSRLANSVRQLRENVGLENRGFLRVLNMSYDALRNIKSEKLKKKQLQALKFVMQKLDENIDDFTATELEGILIDSGLKPTPRIEGIASLYG